MVTLVVRTKVALLPQIVLTSILVDAYDETTVYVSDETTGDSPVGVDFYFIGERGDQFGPL